MTELNDHELLAEFARSGSEPAFAELVARHVNLVYSAALRFCGDAQHCEEITQAVFIILARKAGKLSPRVVLSGWLYQTARLTAANFVKGEIRRQQREQEAYMQSTLNETDAAAWAQLAPLLDEAMGRLGETDRNAVVLRFFENKTAAEVAAALKLTEAAAHKRVNRALEKLRKLFGKRGVTLSATLIAGAVSASSVQAAPTGLAASISTVAITKGAAAGGSTLTLVKGALKIMAWTKAKTAIVSSVVVLLAAGTTTITVKEIQIHGSWRFNGFDSAVLERQPPQVQIFPSKFHGNSHGWGSNGRMMGTGVSASTLVSAAYGLATTARTMLATDLPEGRYDYIASLTNGNAEALQLEVKKEFGVVAKIEMFETNVMLLKVKIPNAPGLKPSTAPMEEIYETWNPGHYETRGKFLGHLTCVLEQNSNVPIIDKTGFTNAFDFNLNWSPIDLKNQNWDNINHALVTLGLELVPGREPIEMLVVEKMK